MEWNKFMFHCLDSHFSSQYTISPNLKEIGFELALLTYQVKL